MFNHSDIIVLTNKLKDAAENIHLVWLCYASEESLSFAPVNPDWF